MLVITTALVVLHAFVTTRTVIGRQIYAVGTKAAKRSGIKTERLPGAARACLAGPTRTLNGRMCLEIWALRWTSGRGLEVRIGERSYGVFERLGVIAQFLLGSLHHL